MGFFNLIYFEDCPREFFNSQQIHKYHSKNNLENFPRFIFQEILAVIEFFYKVIILLFYSERVIYYSGASGVSGGISM